MFIVPDLIFLSSIPIGCFDELRNEAYKALDAAEHVGDDPEVSLKEEYIMDYPPKFTKWIAELIDLYFDKHKQANGFYGIDERHLKMNSLWVNKMQKGDVHKPHTHKGCLYAFVVYISVPDHEDDDAAFCYMHPTHTGDVGIRSIAINNNSEGHILIFPAHMVHTVYPKTTDTVRISVSGNISCYVTSDT